MEKDLGFKGRVALVTGAGSGIGASIAKKLVANGAQVALLDVNWDNLVEVALSLRGVGGCVLPLKADVASPDEAALAVEKVVDHFGSLHMAVNNAGVGGVSSDVSDLGHEAWKSTIDINLSGVFNCLKSEISAMKRSGGGAIVNISSVYADRGLPSRSAYSASKHAIRGLTRTAAIEVAKLGIRINEIQPGVIAVPRQGSNPDEVRRIAERIPVGRVGKGEDIAAATCFLLSNDAGYITGAHLAVDGGFLA